MMDKCGSNFQVASNVYLGTLSNMKVGNNVYIAPNNIFVGLNFEINDDVIIGPNCVFSSGNHQFDGKSFRFLKSIQEKVIIKEGAWIAGNCSIIAGSILPKGSILAAGAVLNKKFDSEYAIYGGVPAKFIKFHKQ